MKCDNEGLGLCTRFPQKYIIPKYWNFFCKEMVNWYRTACLQTLFLSWNLFFTTLYVRIWTCTYTNLLITYKNICHCACLQLDMILFHPWKDVRILHFEESCCPFQFMWAAINNYFNVLLIIFQVCALYLKSKSMQAKKKTCLALCFKYTLSVCWKWCLNFSDCEKCCEKKSSWE